MKVGVEGGVRIASDCLEEGQETRTRELDVDHKESVSWRAKEGQCKLKDNKRISERTIFVDPIVVVIISG